MNKLDHIGIIVDGNGRWAKQRGLIRSEGHLEGSKTLEELILHISKNHKEIKYVSLYVFSIDNFKRDEKEVNYLMDLFIKMFKKVKKTYKNENIKVIFSGRKELLNKNIQEGIKELEEYTKDNTGLTVNYCLSYQGRAEITDTCKKIALKFKNNEVTLEEINENLVNSCMYNELPDVDLLIRTSGEQRISGFMLWQISYAELFFTKTYFPDFKPNEFDEILLNYQDRDRRFGKIKNK